MVNPARHFATPSSLMVVMPSDSATFSSSVASGLRADGSPHALRNLDDLEHAEPPMEPGKTAPVTAFGTADAVACFEPQRGVALILRNIVSGEDVRLLAVLAEHANQTLTDDGTNARSEKKAFDIEVDQARNAPAAVLVWSVVRTRCPVSAA